MTNVTIVKLLLLILIMVLPYIFIFFTTLLFLYYLESRLGIYTQSVMMLDMDGRGDPTPRFYGC